MNVLYGVLLNTPYNSPRYGNRSLTIHVIEPDNSFRLQEIDRDVLYAFITEAIPIVLNLLAVYRVLETAECAAAPNGMEQLIL